MTPLSIRQVDIIKSGGRWWTVMTDFRETMGLEAMGVVELRVHPTSQHTHYRLTKAGMKIKLVLNYPTVEVKHE